MNDTNVQAVIQSVITPADNSSIRQNVSALYTIIQQTVVSVLRGSSDFSIVTPQLSISAKQVYRQDVRMTHLTSSFVQISGNSTTGGVSQVQIEDSQTSASFPASTLQQFSDGQNSTIVVAVLSFNPFASLSNETTYSNITGVQVCMDNITIHII